MPPAQQRLKNQLQPLHIYFCRLRPASVLLASRHRFATRYCCGTRAWGLMLPRAIARLPGGGVRSRSLSTQTKHYYWGSSGRPAPPPPQRRENGCSATRHAHEDHDTSRANRHILVSQPNSLTAPLATVDSCGGSRERLGRRRLSSEAATVVVDPAPEDDGPGDTDDQQSPPAAGLRPETAPASTPAELGCKAYYMARTIDIKTVCTVRCLPTVVLCCVLVCCTALCDLSLPIYRQRRYGTHSRCCVA